VNPPVFEPIRKDTSLIIMFLFYIIINDAENKWLKKEVKRMKIKVEKQTQKFLDNLFE
jgi:hypothetical protein